MTTKVPTVKKSVIEEAFRLMCTAKSLAELYEENFKVVSKYVHATSRGHEAIQLAAGLQLLPQDYAYPYYRDDAMLLGMGVTPYELMLQLLAKRGDVFSGGRTYYSHPSLRDDDRPKIPHQSSATGMQAIPATGAAMGLQYKEIMNISEDYGKDKPFVLCSLGDASVTEGEVSEAFQMACLKQFPILFLVQDNGWDISANAEETRAQNAAEFAKGFHGLEVRSINGSDFMECYSTLKEVIATIREERRPFLVHATVPLLNHHTSGVRKEWYRDDLEEHATRDPYPVMREYAKKMGGLSKGQIEEIEKTVHDLIRLDYERALAAEEPQPEDIYKHIFAPTPIQEEKGIRSPEGASEVVMVDCALHAVEEIMRSDKRSLLYGQDVGGRLGGVFREAATLAAKFGDERVFNTPIQEAFIVGSTVGMAAVGLRPIVEVQFADYIWPGLNQLFTEVARAHYLSNGKWTADMILRVPIGAYGSGGPYHSGSAESVVCNIRGVKVAYPSSGADLKGLMKSAYEDPNPVVIFEHKGLYWSKVKGTDAARTLEPDEDYVLPFGKGRIVLEANEDKIEEGDTMVIISYGMGIHWGLNAAKKFKGRVEIVDLRTLAPLDDNLIAERVKLHGKCLVVSEEPARNSFAGALAGWIQEECFEQLDAPVKTIGSAHVPAIPLNSVLEAAVLPSADKVAVEIEKLLNY